MEPEIHVVLILFKDKDLKPNLAEIVLLHLATQDDLQM